MIATSNRFPDSTKIGGLVSGADHPGDSVLFIGDKTHRVGTVGVAVSGNLEVDTAKDRRRPEALAHAARDAAKPAFAGGALCVLIHLKHQYGVFVGRNRAAQCRPTARLEQVSA